jgi:predicted Fe-Mo cluster-binding NifX family protein
VISVTKYRIEAPVRSFSGESVGVSFNKGTGYVDDSTKEGRAALEYFRRHGYGVAPADEKTVEESVQELVTGTPAQREADSSAEALTNLGHGSAPSVGFGMGVQTEPVTPVEYDPSKHSQDEVIAYLDQSSDEEVLRIKAAESAGKDRKQIAAYERKTTPAPQTRDDDQKGAGQ